MRIPIGDDRLSPVAVEDVTKVAVAPRRSDDHEGKVYEMTGLETCQCRTPWNGSTRPREPASGAAPFAGGQAARA